MKKLRIGVAGLGRAFTLMAPTFAADARVELVAVADPRPEARLDFQGKSYSSVEELCKDPAVEVVYVATPHQFHAEQARLAASHGKHLLVEKPMALTLEDCRSMIDSGYAHFDSDEFSGWIGESGQRKDPAQYGLARRLLRSTRHELALKYGPSELKTDAGPVMHSHFGTLIVSCDKADLRPLPSGVMIYGDAEQRLDPLPPPEVPRAEVIDELYGAIVEGRAPLHSGEWALATMEVCLAILGSAREQKEVALQNQIALPT